MSPQTPLVYQRDIVKRPRIFTIWERRRNSKEVHWAIECFAESMGVFLYVYFGLGSQVGWVVGNILKEVGFSSIFQIGMAYCLGIIFALTMCAGTSGGHFNPCVTITLCIFKGFPKAKAVRYIIAQIFGAYIATLVVYTQWKSLLDISEEILLKSGTLAATQFTPNGPAGAFALYSLPGLSLSRTFMNEFVNCTLIAMIIWSCLDPSNILVPPVMSTFVVALAYAASIWGFSVPGVSLNAARDIGARLAAMTIYGVEAKGGAYSAIAALVNIPATILGATIYELFIVDSDRPVSSGGLEFINHHANHRRTLQQNNGDRRHSVQSMVDLADTSSQEKPTIATFEHAPGSNGSMQV